jgi:hypothetical protein
MKMKMMKKKKKMTTTKKRKKREYIDDQFDYFQTDPRQEENQDRLQSWPSLSNSKRVERREINERMLIT